MARETKVGLLAGLAFIVCFAVILANRGRQELLPSQALAQHAERPGPGRTAPPLAGNELPNGGVSTAAVEPSWSAPPRVDRDPVADAQRLAWQRPAAVTTVADDERVRTLEQKLDALTQAITGRGSQAPESSVEPPVENTVALTATPTSRTRPAPPAEVEAPARAARRHKVVAGDTLYRIAAVHYGAQSLAVVNALYEANRSVVPDRDSLPQGVELILPEIDGQVPGSAQAEARQPSPVSEPRKSEPKPAKPPAAKPASKEKGQPDKTFRWYQVQKNDRYVSIARQQLGDPDRWKEIYELNKEKFPDAGKIREGVRIKLPAEASADARERRR